MTESATLDSTIYNTIVDMSDTTPFQTMEFRNNETEYKISENVHCSFTVNGDPLTVFLIARIGMSVVSFIGIIGNILCAIVLSRPQLRTSTNIILLGLSVFDFVVVLINLLMFGIPWSIQFFCVESFESFYWSILYPIRVAYFFPLHYIGQLGSTYFTVAVTFERFFVVYRPLMARPYCTRQNAFRVSLVIAVFTILFTLPTWWEYRIESVYNKTGTWTKYRLINVLENNLNYLLYYGNWAFMFVYRIIPMTLLTVLNICIYLKIREANKRRESMTQATPSEISVAKMLIWMVSIFLLCNFSGLYLFLREIMGSRDREELLLVVPFLFNLNTSVNFIIYSLMTKKFRNMFLQLFLPKKLVGWCLIRNVHRNEDVAGEMPNTKHYN